MILPGHIALAVFGHKLLNVELPTAIAATLAPDLVDKTLAHVLHLTPSGRYFMHSLVGWMGMSLVAQLSGGKGKGRAWAVGHLAHFIGDGADMPWLLGLKPYVFSPTARLEDILSNAFSTVEGRVGLVSELLLLAASLLLLARDKKQISTSKQAEARYGS